MVLLYDDGRPTVTGLEDINKVLDTIYRALTRCRAGGVADMAEDEDLLVKIVRQSPRSPGLDFSNWTLPTYLPTLNVIDILWRHVRRLVTHNYRFQTLAELKDAAYSTFDTLAHVPDRVLSIIGSSRPNPAKSTYQRLHIKVIALYETKFKHNNVQHLYSGDDMVVLSLLWF